MTYLHTEQYSKESDEASAKYRWILRGWGISAQQFSGVHGPNFTKLGKDIVWSWLHRSLFQSLDILLHFQMRVAQIWVMLKMMPNFTLFDTLWKSGEGRWNLYTNCLSFTYGWTSGIHLMAIHCVAAKSGGLIKKIKKYRKFMGKA